jgi:hypothetical protein
MITAEHLEAATIGADAATLDDLARQLWRSYEAAEISDADAEAVSEAIQTRRAALKADRPNPTHNAVAAILPRCRPKPKPSPDRRARLDRRRNLAGQLPPHVRHHFTEAERSVLALISRDVRHHGCCDRHIDALARESGSSRSTVKRAIREAVRLGLLRRQERRRRGCKSLTNILSVIDPGWRAWLKLSQDRGPELAHRQNPKSYYSDRTPLAALPWGSGRGLEAARRKVLSG